MVAPKKLNFHEKILQKMKKHKRKTSLHALLGLIICLAIIFGSHIFEENDKDSISSEQKNDTESKLTMTFTGDIMMGRHVKEATQKKGTIIRFKKYNHSLKTQTF